MKYTDKNGVTHADKLGLFLGNLGIPMKGVPEFPHVDFHQEDETTSDQDSDVIEIIELHDDKIVGKTADGKIVTTSKVDERLLYGIARDMIQESLNTIDTSDKTMQKVIADIIMDQGDDVNKLAKLYFEGSTDLGMLDADQLSCMASLANNAIHRNPAFALTAGKQFFEELFKSMDTLVREHVADGKV